MPTVNKKVSILWVLFAVAAVLTVMPLIIGIIMALRTGIGGQYWALFVQVVNQLYQPLLLGLAAAELKKGRDMGVFCFAIFLAGWNAIVPLLSVISVFTTSGLSSIFASIQSLGWIGYVYATIILLNWLVTAVAFVVLCMPSVRAHFKHSH